MDKTQLLERYFNGFIDITEPRDFFIGMTDYLDLANSFPEFENIDKDIFASKKEVEEKLQNLRKITLGKVLLAYKEVVKYVEKNKIDNEEISRALRDCEAWIEGGIVGTNSKPLGIHICLGDAVNALYKIPKHKDFALKYVELYKGRPDLVSRFVPIKEVWELMDFEDEFRNKENTELWGQVEHISRLYETVKCGELLRTSMTKNIKSIKTKYRRLKLKCLNTQKLTMTTKPLLLRCFL